ncbi:MAG: signal peptidase I [Ktedonobacteraceae bacterium]|nr:signal peptidase I [Ktedonobacteraceae bacterium]
MEARAAIGYNVRSSSTARGSKVSEKHVRLIREAVETIALTLLILLIIRFAVQSFRTEGQSMEPGLHTGDYVLVNKLLYLWQQPQRGDVIVFHYPLDTHVDFIKRIIGVPGDTISTTSTGVSVDGQLIQEPYISTAFNFGNETWKLGPDQFFVMGDNRDNSLDSRSWGALDRRYIVGKAVAVYWPTNKWKFIDTYQAVFAAVRPSTNQ